MRSALRLFVVALAAGLVATAAASAAVQNAYEAISVGLVADSNRSQLPTRVVFEQHLLAERQLGEGDFYLACELSPLDEDEDFRVQKRGRIVVRIELVREGEPPVPLGKWKMRQAPNGVAVGFHSPAPLTLQAGDRLRWTFRHRRFDRLPAGFGYELLFGVVHSSLLEEE